LEAGIDARQGEPSGHQKDPDVLQQHPLCALNRRIAGCWMIEVQNVLNVLRANWTAGASDRPRLIAHLAEVSAKIVITCGCLSFVIAYV
jgi:hypothetical protein